MKALGCHCDICPLSPLSGHGDKWVRAGGPVPPEVPKGATVLAVGQEPGRMEVKTRRTMCGQSGRLFDKSLLAIGQHRRRVATTNVVLCMSPGGDIKNYEKKLARLNKKLIKAQEAPIPFPSECCRPQLDALTTRNPLASAVGESSHFVNIIPMGGVALKALLPGVRGGILANRGMIVGPDAEGRRYLPTVQPARVFRQLKWKTVFEGDLARAWRFFSDKLKWTAPEMFYRPDMGQLEDLLFNRPGYQWRGLNMHRYDVETDSIYSMTAKLRCIGIGTPEWCVVIPYEPVAWAGARLRGDAVPPSQWYTMNDGSTLPLYTPFEQQHRDELIRRWANDPTILKGGWNSGSYDRVVMECQLGVNPLPHMDGILIQRSVQPDLPHSLAFVGSHWTDVHNWKGDHTATEAKTDEELWFYNGVDVCVDGRVHEPLYAALEAREQLDVMVLDHKSQEACVGMHYVGMLVDQPERQRLGVIYKADIIKWAGRVRSVLARSGVDVADIVKRTRKLDAENLLKREAMLEKLRKEDGTATAAAWAGDEKTAADSEGFPLPTADELGLDVMAFNPMSHPQLRSVLFEAWNLPPPTSMKDKELYTSTGEISTGDPVLRRLLMGDLGPDQRLFIHAIRMSRRWAKLWGTYIRPLRMPVGDTRLDKGCRLWSDGRAHPHWSAHVAITGRLACSGPNLMNIPGAIKTMIVAAIGNCLVGADMNQLEMRVAASLWKITPLLEAFEKELDAYQMTMLAIFGRSRLNALGGGPSVFGKKDFDPKGEYANLRKLAKAVHLASQYAATTETVYRMLTSAEDKATGKLLNAKITLQEAAALHKGWLDGYPEYKAGWEKAEVAARAQGYLREPVTGRRRDFHGESKFNLSEIVNFRIQAGAAGIMNEVMKELVPLIPFNKWGPGTGINNQCHDAITIECPTHAAEWTRQTLAGVMNRKVAGFDDVFFSSEALIAAPTLWDPSAKGGKGDHVPADGGLSRWAHT